MLRLRSAGDTAVMIATAARAEGFGVVNAINANFDKAVAEERRRLADRSER